MKLYEILYVTHNQKMKMSALIWCYMTFLTRKDVVNTDLDHLVKIRKYLDEITPEDVFFEIEEILPERA